MRLRTPVSGTVRFAYHTGGRGNAEIVLTGVEIGGKPITEDVTIPAGEARPEDLNYARGRSLRIENENGWVLVEVEKWTIGEYDRNGVIVFIPF